MSTKKPVKIAIEKPAQTSKPAELKRGAFFPGKRLRNKELIGQCCSSGGGQ